jgi:integrase
MKERQTESQAANPARNWQATPYANLIRYVPSRKYFARIRVRGKLIRKSLKTDVVSVAKLRLADLERSERDAAEVRESASMGRMKFGDAVNIFKEQTEASHLLKSSAKHYRVEVITAILKWWPGIGARDVRKITEGECKTWAAKFSGEYSATRYNAAIGVLRAIFNAAIEAGALSRNPAVVVKRAKVSPKHLVLPDGHQFDRFVKEIEIFKGGEFCKCADLVRFLAFGGFRLSEAANITWSDCDFAKGEIVVRGDLETGTKNWTVRRVPMIPDMRQLLERLKAERLDAEPGGRVMRVRECQGAMNRAAKTVGMQRITHHDLRHLFATRCIESGVDIPTVARWLGHKDGGSLACRVYGHLRDQHSASMAKLVSFEPARTSSVPLAKVTGQ